LLRDPSMNSHTSGRTLRELLKQIGENHEETE
jgi:hypothetical protein